MNVAVIGAGASGLMAACTAAECGNQVTVFEKNEKCGKKIYITGKGRCNLTNAVSSQDFLTSVVTNPKFLTGAIYSFPPEKAIEFFENNGLSLKTERGNRVFPVSDKASDVTKTLEKCCRNLGVDFKFNTEVQKLAVLNGTMSGIIIDGKLLKFDKVIVCTGGKSYPATGSTGDGYTFARQTGHTVIQPVPALCGLNLKSDFYKKLQGLTLKNVGLKIFYCDKLYFEDFGEMLFTHFGISGPIVLTASSRINRLDLGKVKLSIDLKPALSDEKLDERLLREFSAAPNRQISQVMKTLVPSSLIEEILKRCGVAEAKKVNAVTRAERASILTTLKNFDIIISSLQGFNEAIVTSGGVDIKQINPKTMESKLVRGLFFCGEVLDVDALTGGFNLQIAFSTGYAAGKAVGIADN